MYSSACIFPYNKVPSSAFKNCTNLENINVDGVFWLNNANFQNSPLTHQSIINLFNALPDVRGKTTTYTLVLGSNIDKVSVEELNIATDKGWEVYN